MKTKVKRMSKRTLAVFLGVVMLVTSIGFGTLITANATTYYIWMSDNGGISSSNYTCLGASSQSFSATTGKNYYIAVSTSSTSISTGTVTLSGADFTGVSVSSDSVQEFDGKKAYRFALSAASTLTVSYTSGSKIQVSGSGGSTSCSKNKTYRVVGTANIAGTAWANELAANNLTYSETLGCYTKTFSNIAAGTMDFRIIEGSKWSNTWGFDRANKVDQSNLVTSFVVKPNTNNDSDNNIRMTTNSTANIEIRLDDSKTNTSAITVIVTPNVSTVTAAVSPAGSGTATVNGGASASNIAYNNSVSLIAVPNTNYHFDHWADDSNLTYVSASSAVTNATVKGNATATAVFVKDKFTVTKTSSEYYTLTANGTNVAWGETVEGTVTPASGYNVTAVQYTAGGVTQNATYNSSTGAYSFTMPSANTTIKAVYSQLANGVLTYGVNGEGYISVGKQHGSTQNQIEETYDSGATVLQNTKVNFCAIPKKDYKFGGWYTDSECTSAAPASLFRTGDQTTKDVTVNMPGEALTLYAKFVTAPDTVTPDPLAATSGITVYVRDDNAATNDLRFYWWDQGINDPSTTWNTRPQSEDGSGPVTVGVGTNNATSKTYCYRFDFPNSSSLKVKTSLGSDESNNYTINSEGTYVIEYKGKNTNMTVSTHTNTTTTTADPNKQLTNVYPVALKVNNPDKGTTYVNAYATKSTQVTAHHTPANTDDWKTKRTTTGFTANLTDEKTTSTSTERTMPSDYSSSPKFTITYVEKEYFPVTFSSGPNGSVEACTGATWNASNKIKSGALVKEGTSVTFKATANSGYAFAKWTGSSTSTNSTETLSVSEAKNVKGWFKSNDIGTQTNANVYFACSTDSNPNNWDSNTTTKVYIKNGRALGYINNPTAGRRYYFAATSTDNPKGKAEDGKGLYHYDDTSLSVHTDFYPLVDANQYNQQNKKKLYFGGTQYTARNNRTVSKIIVDLGAWNSTGNYIEGDRYLVIPVWDNDATNVDIYAKDGSYRGDSTYDYFPGIADTVLTGATNTVSVNNFEIGSAMRGETITVETTIDETHKEDFYIRGFSFNGVTPSLIKASDGVANGTGTKYSQTYTIPDNFEYDYLEITPIYYYKYGRNDVTADNVVQFYIENYDKALEATGWGNTLSVYPYYQSNSSWVEKKQNSFGGYPGQPVIYYGGRRFVEIPTCYDTFTYDNNGTSQSCTIKGVTLSNDYWDIVHREYCNAVTEHKQTYDYDDFVKIFRETTDNHEKNGKTGLADQITFQFKYRTQTDNFADSSVTSQDKNTGTTAEGYTGVPQPYASFTDSEKATKFGNDWEPLLDYLDRPVDLFGKQLTAVQKELDPILVVSDDYEVTYAGSYATTWTVYARASASDTTYTKIAEIAPSALIVTSKARLDDTTLYPVTADQGGLDPTTLQEFGDAYNSLLAYKERPVQITYESAIENNSGYKKYFAKPGGWTSEKAVRNDGRWTYSYYNDDIHADIRIEYKNDESDAEWTTDAFKGSSNQGTVTGAKAYFTNDETNKAGESFKNKTETGTVVSDQNKFYEFEATAAPGYVFAGWWFERDNIVTDVNDDHSLLTGHSQMTSNATFVARYIKSPTGTLTINHSIADTSDIKDATTYVAVKAKKDGEEDKWLTGEKTDGDHFTQDSFAIDSNYIGYKSGYSFEITLKTVADNDFVSFDRFSAKNDHSDDFFTAGKTTSGRTTTSEIFTVSVDDLFAIQNGFPTQTFDTLTYYSHLGSKTYNYIFNYTYPAYVSKYGTQGYKVRGTFTYDELKNNMKMNESNLEFKDGDKKTAILNKLAPFEDNFRQTISWNTSGAETPFNTNTNTISAEVASSTTNSSTVNLTFKFNYSTNASANYGAAEESDYVAEAKETPLTGTYLDTFKVNGKYITAPHILINKSDGSKEMVFRYWKVSTVGNSKRSSREYTRCYDDEFNFALFQDSIIETVYTVKNTNEGVRDGYDPDAYELADSSLGVTINFMENSRNQYNENQSSGGEGSTEMTSSRRTQGDRMYTDFLLNFNNIAKAEGIPELKYMTNPGTKKVGLIIEGVGLIDMVDGKYQTKTADEYNTLYGDTITEIGQKLSGKETTVNQLTRLTNFINDPSNTANLGTNDIIKGIKAEFNVTSLDNKNRLQYAYSIANRSHSDFSVLNNRYQVYRAYAYIADYDSSSVPKYTNIKISEKPAYFTIYDMASIQNYAEAQASGGIQ